MTEPELNLATMSVRELSDLHAAVQSAIRAAIRKRREESGAPMVEPANTAPTERASERDAWLAARRRRTP